ncbi:MAG: hypothetical protein WCT77_10135 [Bacteroidota bacterium]
MALYKNQKSVIVAKQIPKFTKKEIFFILSLFLFILISQHVAFANQHSPKPKTVLEKKAVITPGKYMVGDTTIPTYGNDDVTAKPGFITNFYTAEQDSAYRRALKLKIPFTVRLNLDLAVSSDKWKLQQELAKGNPWNVAMKNAQVSPAFYMPLPRDIVLYNYNLMQSQYVPGVKTLDLSGGIASLQSIGRFLGIVEDVSPVIKFQLSFQEEVEIVIFSVQAVVITTMYKGKLNQGDYKFTWNLRDSKGKPMPQGDYVAEVRIGSVKYVRKRIQIP